MEFIGKGVYPISYASRITGVSAPRIRRWMSGYQSISNGNINVKQGLFISEFVEEQDFASISFLDMIEVVFIDALRKHGLSLQQIRKAAIQATKEFRSAHPFAMKRLYTDGKDIYLRYLEKNDIADLLDLNRAQYQLDAVILPHLLECIDFNKLDLAERWWPAGRQAGIVVDPEISFGKPIIQGFGVSTALLYKLNKKGRTIKEISDWYEIPEVSIEQAIAFENDIAA